jgi:hypothetical protein
MLLRGYSIELSKPFCRGLVAEFLHFIEKDITGSHWIIKTLLEFVSGFLLFPNESTEDLFCF